MWPRHPHFLFPTSTLYDICTSKSRRCTPFSIAKTDSRCCWAIQCAQICWISFIWFLKRQVRFRKFGWKDSPAMRSGIRSAVFINFLSKSHNLMVYASNRLWDICRVLQWGVNSICSASRRSQQGAFPSRETICINVLFCGFSVQLESYTILSKQTIPGEKPIDEIVLIPSLSRALVLSGTSVHPPFVSYRHDV